MHCAREGERNWSLIEAPVKSMCVSTIKGHLSKPSKRYCLPMVVGCQMNISADC